MGDLKPADFALHLAIVDAPRTTSAWCMARDILGRRPTNADEERLFDALVATRGLLDEAVETRDRYVDEWHSPDEWEKAEGERAADVKKAEDAQAKAEAEIAEINAFVNDTDDGKLEQLKDYRSARCESDRACPTRIFADESPSRVRGVHVNISDAGIGVLIHGGAEGVDTCAKEWAQMRSVPQIAV